MINLDLTARTGSFIALEQTASTSHTASKEDLKDVLTALAELLNLVQTTTANTQTMRANQSNQVAQEMIKSLQANVDKINAEIQAAQNAQNNQSFWSKVINAITAFVGAVLCFIAPEIGIPMLLTAVMNLTGLMDKISDGIATVLEQCGMSKEAANLFSQVIIFATVVALSCGTSSFNGSALNSTFKILTAIGMGLSTANNLFTDAAVVAFINDGSKSDDDKKREEDLLNMIQSILGAAFALVGGIGSACTTAAKAAAQDTSILKTLMKNLGEMIKKNFPSLAEKFGSTYLTMQAALTGATGQIFSNFISKGGQAFLSGATAAFTMQRADATRALGVAQAESMILTNALKTNSNLSAQETASFQARLVNQSKMMADIIHAIDVEGSSFAQALAG